MLFQQQYSNATNNVKQDSIAELTEELCDHVETLKEKEVREDDCRFYNLLQPVLQSLEVEYDTTREDYEVKKKEVIGERKKWKARMHILCTIRFEE